MMDCKRETGICLQKPQKCQTLVEDCGCKAFECQNVPVKCKKCEKLEKNKDECGCAQNPPQCGSCTPCEKFVDMHTGPAGDDTEKQLALWVDPLNNGWTREVKTRKNKKTREKDIYYITPTGDKLDSGNKIKAWLEKHHEKSPDEELWESQHFTFKKERITENHPNEISTLARSQKSWGTLTVANGETVLDCEKDIQALKRDADFRQDGILAGLCEKVKGVASAAGQAALSSLGEEFQALEKGNVRLNDALSCQNGFLAGLWDKVNDAASAAGKAALASLGEEEQAMLMREFQALEKENVRLNDNAMSRQNASFSTKASLASLGEEERAMLQKEIDIKIRPTSAPGLTKRQ